MLAADFDLAARNVRRRCRARGNLRYRHAEARGLGHVDADAHFVRRPGVDDDLRHARYRFDARLDGVLDEMPVLIDRSRGAGQELHEEPAQRFVGVAATTIAADLHDRPVGILRNRTHAVDAPDHFDQRVLHIRADREGQIDEAAAGTGIAIEFFQTGQALQHLLLRFEQFGLDFFGRGRAPVRLN